MHDWENCDKCQADWTAYREAQVAEGFCRSCGAAIPAREGEGTCLSCEPEVYHVAGAITANGILAATGMAEGWGITWV